MAAATIPRQATVLPYALWGALALGGWCCGGAPAAPASSADPADPKNVSTSGEEPSDAIRATDADVPAKLMVALNSGDFDCKPSDEEQGVVICDLDKEAEPTVVLVYQEPLLMLLSHFLRKEGVTCEDVLPKLNELNSMLDPMKLVCIEDRVTFASTLLLPERGLTSAELQKYAGAFQNVIRTSLGTSGLVKSLK